MIEFIKKKVEKNIRPGTYRAKIKTILYKDELIEKSKAYTKPGGSESAPPSAKVVFCITDGKYKDKEVNMNLKLDDDFTEAQRENSQELLNELLDNLAKDKLADCIGSNCLVTLQSYAVKGRSGVFVAGTQTLQHDLSIENDAEFLKGD